MEEYQDIDGTDEEGSEDSPVLKELRNQLRAAQKENEKLQALQAQVEVAAQTQRSEAAKGIVNTLGLPGLTEDVLSWVKGDITQEAVIEALQARSIPLPEGTEQPKPEGDQVVSASAVGQQVADAAAGSDKRDFEQKLNEASTQSELNALMEEAGLARSHS